MRHVVKVVLLAIAYVACFVLGSTTGLIHPACYAYVGALLPLLFAFIFLGASKVIKDFGVAVVLNGVALLVALLIGEADVSLIIGIVFLTALSELFRYLFRADSRKAIRWSFVPFAFSFFAYTIHWWTDTEGSLAAAVEEMPAGYDQSMIPVIDNVPLLIVVMILTIPVAILSMRLAERVLNK
ncbi:MAG: MptD family putative ECF transporter S component [Bacteroidales bacterium]|nr:MptD family putative ECF transporter S component [Bacteroidales bacterium]